MTVATPRAFSRQDIEQPPEGRPLELLSLACHLQVTLADLATAAGVSRSVMSRIAGTNTWPARTSRDAIKAAVLDHLRQAGATDDMLREAFHGHTNMRRWGAVNDQQNAEYRRRALDRENTQRQARRQREALQLRGRRPNNGPAFHGQAGTTTLDEEEGLDDMLIAKQTLTPDARRHFKLFANPFDGEVTTESQMYVGGEVAYVREAVWQCAKTGSFVALVGESGCGKTTVVCDLEERLGTDRGADCQVIRPSVLGMEGNDTRGKAMKSTDILAAVIARLDPSATVPQTLEARTRKAERMLIASAAAGNTHLLVIEEAHSLPDATLKHLKRLHEMRHGRRPLLAILLVAQPELLIRLRQGLQGGHLREVAQRIEIVQFLPLDAELGAYLEHRATAHNRQLSEFIDADAVEALRARLTRADTSPGAAKRRVVSLCYALTVNNWMTRLLNEAVSLGAGRITRDVVQAA